MPYCFYFFENYWVNDFYKIGERGFFLLVGNYLLRLDCNNFYVIFDYKIIKLIDTGIYRFLLLINDFQKKKKFL